MEEPVQFTCNQKRLYGVLHLPNGMVTPSTIVIIITGGPQVRTGAHRLYVQLSRFLSEQNWPSFRFDYEGMGDSEGDFVGFQYAEPSITSAINFLQNKFKSRTKFIFWSLCDGATAAALYGAIYPEHISGMILCNPLVITDEGLARSTIKHYYCRRLLNKDLWRKLVHFELDLKDTFASFLGYLKEAQFLKNNKSSCAGQGEEKLPVMIIDSLQNFAKPIRIILSTDDIVASNFQDEVGKKNMLKNRYKHQKIINHFIYGADHTFVDSKVKEELLAITLKTINEMESSDSEKEFRPA